MKNIINAALMRTITGPAVLLNKTGYQSKLDECS